MCRLKQLVLLKHPTSSSSSSSSAAAAAAAVRSVWASLETIDRRRTNDARSYTASRQREKYPDRRWRKSIFRPSGAHRPTVWRKTGREESEEEEEGGTSKNRPYIRPANGLYLKLQWTTNDVSASDCLHRWTYTVSTATITSLALQWCRVCRSSFDGYIMVNVCRREINPYHRSSTSSI